MRSTLKHFLCFFWERGVQSVTHASQARKPRVLGTAVITSRLPEAPGVPVLGMRLLSACVLSLCREACPVV